MCESDICLCNSGVWVFISFSMFVLDKQRDVKDKFVQHQNAFMRFPICKSNLATPALPITVNSSKLKHDIFQKRNKMRYN